MLGKFELPAVRTHEQFLEFGAEVTAITNPTLKANASNRRGCKRLPAFYLLSDCFSTVDNVINDFMHLFYNVILLIFSYICRMNFSKKRKQAFHNEKRNLNPDDPDDIINHPPVTNPKIYKNEIPVPGEHFISSKLICFMHVFVYMYVEWFCKATCCISSIHR